MTINRPAPILFDGQALGWLTPPEFNSDLNGEMFIDWLSIDERVFDLKDVPENKKVKL